MNIDPRQTSGLICAFRIEKNGIASPLDLEALTQHEANGDGWVDGWGDGWTWAHFDVASPQTKQWFASQSGIEPHVVEALLSEETRPRATRFASGTLIILRGVNLQPASVPTDMISIRLWVEKHRIISTRIRRLLSVRAIRERCERNDAPVSVGDFLVDLNVGLIERMAGVVQTLEDEIDELEAIAITEPFSLTRARLADERQKIIPLRRFLSPQRDAIAQLQSPSAEVLSDVQRGKLRECADSLTRYIEDLDAMREKAVVIQDSVTTLLAEQMNRTMLVLSLATAIFLPLGLLTGLLGINVAGIPGAEISYAFWIVVIMLCAVAAVQIWLFRRLGLLGTKYHSR